MPKILLTIELIPSTSWADNVRAILTPKQWGYLRSQVYAAAYHICQICGGVGPKHPVECHEIWSFNNKTLIQKLEGMIALCPDCHMVKHIGLAEIRGQKERAIQHLMFVNKMTWEQAETYVFQCFKLWNERSKKIWTLDLTHLKEYGVDIDKIKKNK